MKPILKCPILALCNLRRSMIRAAGPVEGDDPMITQGIACRRVAVNHPSVSSGVDPPSQQLEAPRRACAGVEGKGANRKGTGG